MNQRIPGDAGTSVATLQSLEVCRIIAALLVVTAHVPAFNVPVIGQFLGATRFLGSIGVDLFFVISGVVIGLSSIRSISCDAAGQLRHFLVARFFRIFPLYWSITAITIGLAWHKGLPLPPANEVLHSLTLLPRLVGDEYVDPIVHVGWTLQFELFFYVLCALGIVLRSRWVPLIISVALAALSFVVNQYYANPIILEFAAGYVLAMRLTYRPSSIRTSINPVVTLTLLICVVAIFLLAATGRDGGYSSALDAMRAPHMMMAYGQTVLPRVLAWGVPAFFVVLFIIRFERVLNWRLAFLGKYTYSVYMCHTFGISAAIFLARHLSRQEDVMLLFLPFTVFLIAACSYWLIERPTMQIGKRLFHSAQRSQLSTGTLDQSASLPTDVLSNLTVVLQGNYTEETARIIRELKATAPNVHVIVSCWQSNSELVTRTCSADVTVVFSDDPGTPIVGGFKGDNIRRQIVSTRAGLRVVNTPWVLKLRSDISIDLRKFTDLGRLCNPVSDAKVALFDNKVVVTSLTTLDAARSGLYFHVCDWVYFGKTEDVSAIFNAPLPEDDFFRFFERATPAPEICSQYRSETYLIYHRVRERIGVEYPHSGFRDAALATLSRQVLRANFAVVNPWNIGLRSNKHRKLYLWLRWDRHAELACGARMAEVGLVRAINAFGYELASRVASVVATELVDVRNRVRLWRA